MLLITDCVCLLRGWFGFVCLCDCISLSLIQNLGTQLESSQTNSYVTTRGKILIAISNKLPSCNTDLRFSSFVSFAAI